MITQKFVYKIIASKPIKRLALEEIRSIYIASLKMAPSPIKVIGKDTILLELPFYAGLEIARRASFIKYAGILLDDKSLQLLPNLHFKSISGIPNTFALRTMHDLALKDLQEEGTLGRVFKALKYSYTVNLRNPYYEIDVLYIEDSPFLSLRLPIGRLNTLHRDPLYKPFAPPATMDSILSRALVNLSRINIGDIFLDPFCGSGSLLIEAYFIGALPIGIEIHPKNAYGAIFNTNFVHSEINIIIGDATNMPLPDQTIDGIATDPPYGRSASTFKLTISRLYQGFLEEAFRVLKKGKYLTMCYPPILTRHISNVVNKIGFREIFNCKLFVHKGLTRLISVLFVP